MSDPRDLPWWRSAPGLLFSLALLIAAVAALLLTLHRIGIIGERDTAKGAPVVSRADAAKAGPDPATVAQDPRSLVAGAGLGGQPTRVIFASPRDVTLGKENNVTYTIRNPSIETRNAESVRLVLMVRMNNQQAYQANFWDASFRLVTDNEVIAASGGLNVVVDARSFSAEQRIVFNVPNRAEVRALRITYLGESTDLPLRLQ